MRLPPPFWPICLDGRSSSVCELSAPLLEQWFAVGEDERRQLPFSDQCAGDHCLAGSGWRDENAVVVREHRAGCVRLQRAQLAAKHERQLRVGRSAVVGHEPASGVRDRVLNLAMEATWKMEVGQVLLVAADQPRCLVGGEPKPLPLVEERIVQRCQVFELGQQ